MAENDEKKTLQETAAEIAGAGISSYTHGSRSVSKISPNTLLDVDARLRASAARRRGGLFVTLDQGGGAARSGASGGGGGGGGGVAGVASLNGLTGDLKILQGENVTIAMVGNSLVISATGGGSGGVESVNGLDGAVALEAGDNVDVAVVGGKVRISGQAGGVTSVNGLSGAVGIVGGHNVTVEEDAQGRVEISSSGASPFIPETRVVAVLSATVLPTDYLLWFDSEAAGDEQELTLPDMDADAMTIVVRHLGGDYPTTIRRGQRTYQLSGDGAAVAIDWLKATREWYWRQAY